MRLLHVIDLGWVWCRPLAQDGFWNEADGDSGAGLRLNSLHRPKPGAEGRLQRGNEKVRGRITKADDTTRLWRSGGSWYGDGRRLSADRAARKLPEPRHHRL